MNGRMAVMAAIVSWLSRGASPVDGMYWFDTRESRKSLPEAEPRSCAVPAGDAYAHCG